MKGLILIILFFVMIITNSYVESAPPRGDMEPPSKDCNPPKNRTVAVYVMGAIIGFLLAIIVSLLAYIYKLKHSKTVTLDDKIHITRRNSVQKYERQVSTETSDIPYKIETSSDSKRLLSRQGSKLTILDYPDHTLTRTNQNDDVTTNTLTASKPVRQEHKEHIEEIRRAIIGRAANMNESNRSTDDTKIINDKTEEPISSSVQKSVSSPFLDAAKSFESHVTPSLVKKLQKFPALTQNDTEKANEEKKNENISFSAFKLGNNAKSGSTEVNDRKVLEKICEPALDLSKSDKNNKLTVLNESIYDQQDEVYDDIPKITRPVVTLTEVHSDGFYDNPSNVPVCSGESAEDLYESPPCNKPVYSDNELSDDVYDNPTSNKSILDGESDARKTNRANKTTDDDDYDLPKQHGRGITITEDSDTGYFVPVTDDKETCFNSSYINAKSYVTDNLK